MQKSIYRIVVMNQFNSECYILIQNEIGVRHRHIMYKRLYHYLWDKCPGCELEMSKIIFQYIKPKNEWCKFGLWFQVNNFRICVGKNGLGHLMAHIDTVPSLLNIYHLLLGPQLIPLTPAVFYAYQLILFFFGSVQTKFLSRFLTKIEPYPYR